MEKAPEILVDGVRVAAVDKKRAALYIGCPQLIEKMLWATRHNQYDEPWLEIVHNFEGNPKSKTLISTKSLEAAYLRLKSGEVPGPIGEDSVHMFESKGRMFFCGSNPAVDKSMAEYEATRGKSLIRVETKKAESGNSPITVWRPRKSRTTGSSLKKSAQ